MDFRHIGVSEKRKQKQRGATLVMFTVLAACVLVPMVGLAIDGSIAFWAKAKLSAAVDAAVLAAGRNVNGSSNSGTNQNTAQLVASQWFNANFPPNWLGSTVLNNSHGVQGPDINYVMTSSSTQQVTVSASASIPLYFMRVVGQNSITVSATAQSSRRQVYILLILDKSTSMTTAVNGSQTACDVMKIDAVQFTNMFTNGFDTMGLLEFASTANPNLDVAPETTFQSDMKSTIGALDCGNLSNHIQFTSTAQALSIAYNKLNNAQLPNNELIAVVLFTDGQPDELVADYPVRTAAEIQANNDVDQRYDPNSFSPTTYPASGCPATIPTILGGLQANSWPPPPVKTGQTWGLADITQNWTYVQTPGCAFSSNQTLVRKDIAYIPSTDHYGNFTNQGYTPTGYAHPNSPYYGPVQGSTPPDRFPSLRVSGIRSDTQQGGINAAAINAADCAAQRIRNDFNPAIYTIGLGGNAQEPIDAVFLQRIANDPAQLSYTGSQLPFNIYDPTKKAGAFVYAANASQLNAAFAQVASQILRLSH